MPRGIKHSYNDEWIAENWRRFRNWNRMCDEYNQAHDTAFSYNTFKSHCNRELGLNYHYSEEQKSWLKENFPRLGRVKCTKAFNEVFKENRTVNAIKIVCIGMGLHVTEERRSEVPIENSNRFYDVGTIVAKQHGEPYVKTENGWVRLKDLVYGEKPQGRIIAHLDRDVGNCSKDNLIAITRSTSVRMAKNRFWSEDPVITKTGIMCCELEELLSVHQEEIPDTGTRGGEDIDRMEPQGRSRTASSVSR